MTSDLQIRALKRIKVQCIDNILTASKILHLLVNKLNYYYYWFTKSGTMLFLENLPLCDQERFH